MAKEKAFRWPSRWNFIALMTATVLIFFNLDPHGEEIKTMLNQKKLEWVINIFLAIATAFCIHKGWKKKK